MLMQPQAAATLPSSSASSFMLRSASATSDPTFANNLCVGPIRLKFHHAPQTRKRTIHSHRHRHPHRRSSYPIMASSGTASAIAPKWAQKTVTIAPQRRGCHLITSKILKEIGQDLSGFRCGLAHLFLQHTSASLTINENYDSDVRDDTETFLNGVVPEGISAPWKHTLEGPDDMPAHIKSSMFGCTLMIPITNGKLNMGTWQGIWLCEHRDSATARQIVVTLNGL